MISEHVGRTVKWMGDGALVEFASAVNAVNCGFAIQKAMAVRNSGVPDAEKLQLRIGINIGDVIVVEGDLYGDSVNIAARLEALADPGAICVSGKVHEEIAGKIEDVFVDAGEQHIKNIARPVRVWRWVAMEA